MVGELVANVVVGLVDVQVVVVAAVEGVVPGVQV